VLDPLRRLLRRLRRRTARATLTNLLNPGDQAPDFEVPDHHGQTVRLADLAGKRFVLWFYPKADTPG
jgi:peroxiredoxin